ncbi:nitroreductase [uncultured Maricaulis sp.]|uniref:nitroreductase family protein n=1 Tax=uncultured Maricaulis sp. TaxID=174710 RepID=UPI0026061C91|nr:nitroreductase [uncultured Maricaulis sp.]
MNDTPFPPFPTPGERLAPSHASADTIVLLSRRRSATAITMAEPGPTPAQRDRLLGIAARVPDHGKLAPWRFIVFEGEARARFGKTLGEVYADTHPDATDAQIRFESERLTRAPLVVAVISNVVEKHKVPEWEQILSSGAVCQNLLIAASAMGFGAQWLTEWYAFDPRVKDSLNLRSGERVAGFIYIGSVTDEPVERARPPARVEFW